MSTTEDDYAPIPVPGQEPSLPANETAGAAGAGPPPPVPVKDPDQSVGSVPSSSSEKAQIAKKQAPSTLPGLGGGSDLVDYLTLARELGASDLHVVVGAPPLVRVEGLLKSLGERELTAEETKELIFAGLREPQRAKLETEWELDYALQIDGAGRFRCNAHFAKGAVEAAFRHIPDAIPELESLGHSKEIGNFCDLRQGLLLVTGITGSGKTTTLAALTKRILENRVGVVITIEDPIEFVFEHGPSTLVKQRQIGTDSHDFPAALRSAMRQDPDVIIVSELRDLDTIQTAITAAETGHLVIGTLHTMDAPKTVDRIIDAFPGDRQAMIAAQLANSLVGVVSQRLLLRKGGGGRVLATELMKVNSGMATCIRDQKLQQMVGLIEVGAHEGMHTFDADLTRLVKDGYLSVEEALPHTRNPEGQRADWAKQFAMTDMKQGFFNKKK